MRGSIHHCQVVQTAVEGLYDTPVLFLFSGARRADGSGDTPVLVLFLGARRADGSSDTPSRIVVVGRQVLTLVVVVVVVVVVGSSLSSSSSTVVGSSLSSSSSSTSSSSDPVHPETARACAICIARCRLGAAVCKLNSGVAPPGTPPGCNSTK